MRGTREAYISVDVEADGLYSLVSIGACVAAVRGADGEIEVVDPETYTFYRELQPISERWDASALAVSGLTREHLLANGTEPASAMGDLASWVDGVAEVMRARPVFAAYPLAFDWQFAYHYLVAYAGRSPFGHSARFDMKTAYALLAGTAIRDAVKRNMPASLLGPRRHTHNALDDAQGQADLLAGLLTWRRGGAELTPP